MDFRGDERGQPVQIGFILLFGILVLAFASYQGYVVPNQNAQIEFQHSQAVTSDMQQFRVNILNAAENGQRVATDFSLGTNYPPRLIALNPPPATGSIRTEPLGSGEFRLVGAGTSLEGICGYSRNGDGAVPSRGLVYQASYSELQDEPRIVYENTVAYRSFERSGSVQFDSGQTLVDGQTITVPPLVGNVSEQGTQTFTVDVFPGRPGVGETAGSSLKLVVPTGLTVAHWEELLEDEMAPDGPVTNVSANGSDVEIELESAEYDVVCPVVGTDGAPGNTPDRVRGGGDDINPGGAGDVRLSNIERQSNMGSGNNRIVLSFTNPGDDVNMSTARFNFYQADKDGPDKDGPDSLNIYKFDRSGPTLGPKVIDNLLLRGTSKSPTSTTRFPGDDQVTAIAVEFDDAQYTPSAGEFFVLNIGFSDDQRANYFVDVPPKSKTVSDPPTADFTYSPTNPSTDETIDFTSTASDSDGNVVSYEWDWDDDGNFEGSGETAQHSYTSADTYNVTHRVTDDSGATDTMTKEVTVGSSSDTSPPTVNTLTASAQSTGGNSNEADVVEFAYDVSDSSGMNTIEFVVSHDGNQVGSTTLTNPSNSGSQTVSIQSTNPSPGKPLSVEVTFTDDSANGNSRTCTGDISDTGESISRSNGDINCNP